MFKGLLITILLSISLFAQTNSTKATGRINGYQTMEEATRMQTGWYDMRKIVTADMYDTIKIDSLFGAGVFARQVMSASSTDGRISVKCANGAYYIPVIIASGQSSGLLPDFTRILKSTTTVDTFLVFLQLSSDTLTHRTKN
jgi:hypothetical protein